MPSEITRSPRSSSLNRGVAMAPPPPTWPSYSRFLCTSPPIPCHLKRTVISEHSETRGADCGRNGDVMRRSRTCRCDRRPKVTTTTTTTTTRRREDAAEGEGWKRSFDIEFVCLQYRYCELTTVSTEHQPVLCPCQRKQEQDC